MIHFDVNMDDLIEIERALGMVKDKSKMVLRTAINNTAKQTEKRMVDGGVERYVFRKGKRRTTKGNFREANTIKKATTGKLESKIVALGEVNELLAFHVQPSTYFPGGKGAPKWVKARVTRESKLEKIALRPNAEGDKYKAFVIRYKSGHFALAQRVPGERMKSKPWKEAVKSLLSPSVPKMEENVYHREIDDEMYDILQRNIQEQIQRYLG